MQTFSHRFDVNTFKSTSFSNPQHSLSQTKIKKEIKFWTQRSGVLSVYVHMFVGQKECVLFAIVVFHMYLFTFVEVNISVRMVK